MSAGKKSIDDWVAGDNIVQYLISSLKYREVGFFPHNELFKAKFDERKFWACND